MLQKANVTQRAQDEDRIAYIREIYQNRDQSVKKKRMHSKINQVIDQTDGRKRMRSKINQVRDEPK